MITEISEEAKTEKRNLGFRKRGLGEKRTWNKMLKKRIRCRKIKNRHEEKDRTRREDRKKGCGERRKRNSVWEDISASVREAGVLVETGCGGGHME